MFSLIKVIYDILTDNVSKETINTAKNMEHLNIDVIKIVAGGNPNNLEEVNKLAKEELKRII